MNHRFALLLITASMLCGTLLQAEDPPTPANTPSAAPVTEADEFPAYEPSDALPAPYKEYIVFSDSPDGQYGLMSLRRSALNAPEKLNHLFLIAQKPFQVLTEIPLIGSDLERGHSTHEEYWAKDSSAVVIVEGSKWGPETVFVVPIQRGHAGKASNLTAAVRKLATPDFKKSKAACYNYYYDYIFMDEYFTGETVPIDVADDEDRQLGISNKPCVIKDYWGFNEQGQVAITCICTNDPKEMDDHPWTVRFDGVWDVAQRKFVQKKLVRLKRRWKPQG